MVRRSYVVIAVCAVIMALLAACGGGVTATEDRTEAIPSAVQADALTTVQSVGGGTGADEDTSTPGDGDQNASTNEASLPTAESALSTAESALSTVDVVKILTPSVVHILTEISGMRSFNQAVPSQGVGTGIILDEQGNILTNNHVIADAQAITVTLNNGESFPAQIIGRDANTDLAVVRIEADNLQPATLGRSADLQVGEDVIAVGHALGLPGGPTVSKGVVSAIGRSIDVDAQTTMVDLIQTDASINPGNSGGPLSNAGGEVIGINSAGIPSSQNIGFAINIDDAQIVVTQLLESGFVNRGFLGITPISLSPSLASQVDVPADRGVLVVRVAEGTPADMAGLLAEDVIVQIGGESISNTGELSKFLAIHPPGETVDVGILRGNEQLTLQLTLGERPRQ